MNDAASTTFERDRDRHLFGPGPKRILSLDGGGVRGAISVAFLERVEAVFSEHEFRTSAAAPNTAQGPDMPRVRLGDHFDLVGGTSTGAVIAGALALGYRTADIKDFYLRLAPRVFKRPFWRIQGLQSKFDARLLRDEIMQIVKDRTLDSPDLITGFGLVAKRMDTGSPWILSNNPRAPYWDTASDREHLANKDYKLVNLVRASTAAPHFFDPEILPITKEAQKDPQNDANAALAGNPWLSFWVSKLRALRLMKKGQNPETHGLFVDGGVSPYNNPSLALLMLAVLKPYQLCWPLGPERLTIVSIGTGSHRNRLSFKELGFAGPLRLAIKSLLSMMGDSENLTLAQMQWLGECPNPWVINSEVGTLSEEIPAGHRWFRFMRYDLRLERPWLKDNLGLDLPEKDIVRYRNMDDPGIIKSIYDLAVVAAEKQVKPEHFFGGGGVATPT